MASVSLGAGAGYVQALPEQEDCFSPPRKKAKAAAQQVFDDNPGFKTPPRGKLRKVSPYTNMEPEKWYTLSRNENGNIRIDELPTDVKKASGIIYVWRNTQKETLFIGKTEAENLGKRLNGYYYQFDHPTERPSQFINDVVEHPEHFEFGIYPLGKDIDLFEAEIEMIKAKRRKYDLYNQNDGGGGSSTAKEERYLAITSPDRTPKGKRYHVQQDESGKYRFQFSPGILGKMKTMPQGTPIFYEAQLEIDNDSPLRYRGVTHSHRFEHRFTDHISKAELFMEDSDKYDPNAKGGKLYPAMGAAPETCSVSVFDVLNSPPPKLTRSLEKRLVVAKSSAEMEKILIAARNTFRGEKGLNGNGGGGGGGPSKLSGKKRNRKLAFDSDSDSDTE